MRRARDASSEQKENKFDNDCITHMAFKGIRLDTLEQCDTQMIISPDRKIAQVEPMEESKDLNQRRDESKEDSVVKTPIMDKYAGSKPSYEQIAERKWTENDSSMKLYSVCMNGSKKPSYVIKITEIPCSYKRKIDSLLREFSIGRRFGSICRNVAKPFDIKQITIGGSVHTEMLIEYGGKDLRELKHELSKEDVIKIIGQLINTLELMERIGIEHFDNKPSNIVWDKETATLKLIDFGTSMSCYIFPETIKSDIGKYKGKTIGFTKVYAPPQVSLIGQSRLNEIETEKWDIFCFGMTLIEILLGDQKMIFRDGDSESDLTEYMKNVKRALENTDYYFLIDLIKRCIRFKPSSRPTFKDAKKKFLDVLNKNHIHYQSNEDERFEGNIDHKDWAQTHSNLGDYSAAIWNFNKYLEIGKYDKVEKHHIYQKLSWLHSKCMDAKRTIEYSEKAVKFFATLDCGLDLAISYDCLGQAYSLQRQYEKAIYFYEKAAGIKKKLVGDQGPDIAVSYNFLGIAYFSLGKYYDAKKFHTQAMKIRKEVLGEKHPYLALSYSNLGMAYNSLKKYGKAIKYYEKAINIQKNAFGEMHPDLALSYNNLGIAYYSQAQYDKATDCYTQSICIKEVLLGKEHPDLAISYSNLGNVYKSLNKYAKAVEYHRKAKDIQEKVLGEEHPDLATVYYNLGNAYNSLKEYDDAIKYYIQAIDINNKALREEHSDQASLYKNLAYVFDSLMRYDKAIFYYTKAMNIEKKVFGKEHPDLASLYKNLGNAYASLARYEEAIFYYTKAINIKKKVLGEGHPDLASLYQILEKAYASLARYDKPIGSFEESRSAQIESFRYPYPALNAINLEVSNLDYQNEESYPATSYKNPAGCDF